MSIPYLMLEFGSSDGAVGSWSWLSSDTESCSFRLGEADIETLISQIQRQNLPEPLQTALIERVRNAWDMHKERSIQNPDPSLDLLNQWLEALSRWVSNLEKSLRTVNDHWVILNKELASITNFNEEELLQK